MVIAERRRGTGFPGPRGCLGLTLALTIGLGAGAARAQDSAGAEGTPASADPPYVWETFCRPEDGGRRLGCVLTQTLMVPETRGRLLRVDIRPAAGPGQNSTIQLLFPHGLRLDAVLGLRVDQGKLFKVPLTRSAAEGVYAIHNIGADTLAAMSRGRVLNVSALTETGQVMDLPLSLYGFSAALQAVELVQAAQQ
jgi:invasion protein IalB